MWKMLTALSISFCSISSKWASWGGGADSFNSMLCERSMAACTCVCADAFACVYALLARSGSGVSSSIATVLILETRLLLSLELATSITSEIPGETLRSICLCHHSAWVPGSYHHAWQLCGCENPNSSSWAFATSISSTKPPSCPSFMSAQLLQRPCSHHIDATFGHWNVVSSSLVDWGISVFSYGRAIKKAWSFHTTLERMPQLLPFGSEASLFRYQVFFKMIFVCIVISLFKFVFF